MEPFGDAFLRGVIGRLLVGDIAGVREIYLTLITALRARALPTWDVSSRVRLTKSPEKYLATREARRELPYEALLASGQNEWSIGDRIRVYRKRNGEAGVVASSDDDEAERDPRDYDIDYYVRLLRTTYAERLSRAFTPEDFCVVFADGDQYSLFTPPIESIRTILTMLPEDPALS